jgi:hypothetical protein
MDNPSVDITWIFLQSIFMALNTVLWSTSYSQIRALHSKEEVEELADIAISIMTRCRERWPGSASAAELYTRLTKACLKAYDGGELGHSSSSISANSPASLTDAASPQSELSSATTGSVPYPQKPMDLPPAFGYVFDQAPDSSAANEYHNSIAPPPLAFRSGSIFVNPPTRPTDRRFSYFPPESTQQLQPPQHLQPTQQFEPPPAWGSMSLQPSSSPLHISTSPAMSHSSMVNESSYFMNPQYNFGPQLYAEQNFNMPDRQGSLSFQQQRELMDSLEADPLSNIDSYLNMDTSQPYYNPSNP